MANTVNGQQYSKAEHKVKSGMILFSATMLILVVLVGFLSNYNSLLALHTARDMAQGDVKELLEQQAAEATTLAEKLTQVAPLETDSANVLKAAAARAQAVYEAAKQTDSEIPFTEFIKTDEEMNAALNAFKDVVDKYESIKGSEEYKNIYDEQAGTLAYLTSVRGDYNAVIKSYNTKIKLFPSNIISNIMEFEPWDEYPEIGK